MKSKSKVPQGKINEQNTNKETLDELKPVVEQKLEEKEEDIPTEETSNNKLYLQQPV